MDVHYFAYPILHYSWPGNNTISLLRNLNSAVTNIHRSSIKTIHPERGEGETGQARQADRQTDRQTVPLTSGIYTTTVMDKHL